MLHDCTRLYIDVTVKGTVKLKHVTSLHFDILDKVPLLDNLLQTHNHHPRPTTHDDITMASLVFDLVMIAALGPSPFSASAAADSSYRICGASQPHSAPTMMPPH